LEIREIKILFISDIIGRPGLHFLEKHLQRIKDDNDIDMTIANGENGAAGKGLSPKIAKSYFDLGINVITTGNHIWNRRQFYSMLDQNPYVLRPLNYPAGCPGHGSCTYPIFNHIQVGIINLQGRSFMYPIDCPFRTIDRELDVMKKQGIRVIIVDFHAEATAEKMALGWYLDGRVSCIIGTHTHVQTADEKILPDGSAYITDAGMTGAFNSVIGMEKEAALHRFLTQLPVPYKVAEDDIRCCGVIITVDIQTGKSKSISRFQLGDEGSMGENRC